MYYGLGGFSVAFLLFIKLSFPGLLTFHEAESMP